MLIISYVRNTLRLIACRLTGRDSEADLSNDISPAEGSVPADSATPSTEVSETESSDQASVEVPEQEGDLPIEKVLVKRGRGRPRKIPEGFGIESSKPKRPRGRPRKSDSALVEKTPKSGAKGSKKEKREALPLTPLEFIEEKKTKAQPKYMALPEIAFDPEVLDAEGSFLISDQEKRDQQVRGIAPEGNIGDLTALDFTRNPGAYVSRLSGITPELEIKLYNQLPQDLVIGFHALRARSNPFETQNLLLSHKYLASEPGLIYFTDWWVREVSGITECVMVVTDACSRVVVGLKVVKSTNVSADDYIVFLTDIFKKWPVPLILHGDQGGCFQSKKLRTWLQERGVNLSFGGGFNNQAAESMNNALVCFLEMTKSELDQSPMYTRLSAEERAELLVMAQNYVNHEPRLRPTPLAHSRAKVYDIISKLPAEQRLFVVAGADTPSLKAYLDLRAHFLVGVDNLEAALKEVKQRLLDLASVSEISEIRVVSLTETFSGLVTNLTHTAETLIKDAQPVLLPDTLESFTTLRTLALCVANMCASLISLNLMMSDQLKALLQTTEKGFNVLENLTVQIRNQNIELKKQIEQLTAQNESQSEQIGELVAGLREQKAIQLAKQQAKEKKKNRQRRPAKDEISDTYFDEILKSIDARYESRFIVARYRIALIILRLTGSRIGSLKSISLEDLKNLFEARKVQLEIEKGPRRINQEYVVPSSVKRLLQNYKSDLDALVNEPKLENRFPFQLSRSHLTREINKILKDFCKERKISSNWTSHSFRVTVATAISKEKGILKAKEYLGHKSIQSTQHYVRDTLTSEEKKDLMSKQVWPLKQDEVKRHRGRPKKEQVGNQLVSSEDQTPQSERGSEENKSV
jgi:integrase